MSNFESIKCIVCGVGLEPSKRKSKDYMCDYCYEQEQKKHKQKLQQHQPNKKKLKEHQAAGGSV